MTPYDFLRRSFACRAAFTLIELLTACVIVAILAAVTVPMVRSARSSSENARTSANLRLLHNAALSYAADNGGFLPPGIGGVHNIMRSFADGGYIDHSYDYIYNLENALRRQPAYLYSERSTLTDDDFRRYNWRFSYSFNRYLFGNFSTSDYENVSLAETRPENWMFTETAPGNSNFAVSGRRLSLGWRDGKDRGNYVVTAGGSVQLHKLDAGMITNLDWIYPYTPKLVEK